MGRPPQSSPLSAAGGVSRSNIGEQGHALATSGWGLGQLLHPESSGLSQAIKGGYAGAPSAGAQLSGIIESAPSGFLNLAKGVATDPVAGAVAGAGIGAGAGAGVFSVPGAAIGGAIGGAIGTVGYGIRKLFDDKTDPLETTKQFAQSFERSGNRFLHPSEYAKASKRGDIVGAIVEDLTNASIVFGGAAKGVSGLTGGAAERAALSEAAAKAASTAALKHAGLASDLADKAATLGIPEVLRASHLSQAEFHRGAAAGQSEWALRHAADAALHRESAGGLLPVYKGLKETSHLGMKGAMLPAAPYLGAAKLAELAGKWISPHISTLLAKSDVGVAILGRLKEVHDLGVAKIAAHKNVSGASSMIHQGEMDSQAVIEPVMQGHLALEQKVPDRVEQMAGLAIVKDFPRLYADLGDKVGPDVLHHVINGVTGGKEEFGITPEVLDLAIQVSKGTAPADVIERVGHAEQIWREKILGAHEAGYAAGAGLTAAEKADPVVQAHRDWQQHGVLPNEETMRRAVLQREEELAAQQEKVTVAHERANAAVGRRVYEPGQVRAPVATEKANLDAANQVASQFVAAHPDVVAAAFPGQTRTPAQVRAVADVIVEARATGTVDQLVPELANMIGSASGFVGDRGIVGSLKPVEGIIRQGAHEGRAAGMSDLVVRYDRRAREATARGDKAAAKIERARARVATERLNSVHASAKRAAKAQARVEKLTAQTQADPKMLTELKAAVESERRNIRSKLKAQADEEMQNLIDDLGGAWPTRGAPWAERVDQGGLSDRRNVRDEYDALREAVQNPRWIDDATGTGLIKGRIKQKRGVKAENRVGAGSDFSTMIEDYANRFPELGTGSGVESSEVIAHIAERIDAIGETRDLAQGMISRGADTEAQAVAALTHAGFGYDEIHGGPNEAGVHEPGLLDWIAPRLDPSTGNELRRSVAQAAETVRGHIRPSDMVSGPRFKEILDHIQARLDAEAGTGPTRADLTGPGVDPNLGTESGPLLGPPAEAGVIPKTTTGWPADYTPFERKVADIAFAETKKLAAERGLEHVSRKVIRRFMDEAGARGQVLGRAEGQAAGLGVASKIAAEVGQAASRAADGPQAGVSRAVATLTGRAYGEGVRTGRIEAGVAQALREVGVQERTYRRLDRLGQERIVNAYHDLANSPNRGRDFLTVARRSQEHLEGVARQLESISQDAADYMREVAADIPITLAKAVDDGYNPQWVIGGKLGDDGHPVAMRSQAGKLPRSAKRGEGMLRETTLGPSSAPEATALIIHRLAGWVQNETADKIQGRFGVGAAQIVGRPGDDPSVQIDTRRLQTAGSAEARKQVLDEINKEASAKGLMVLYNGGGVAFVPANLRSGQALVSEMAAQGYVAWDPRMRGGKPAPDQVSLTKSVFMPAEIIRRFERQVGPASPVEQFFRTFYDRPMRLWKDQVLALSPRWQVNNIVGGAVTATAGGGINPIVYGRNFVRGVRIMRAIADVSGEKLLALEKSDSEAAAIAHQGVDPRLHQRSAGSSLEPVQGLGQGVTIAPPSGSKVVRGYKKATGASYSWNGFVDDANRLSVFLTERERMTDAQLSTWLTKQPHLAEKVAGGSTRAVRDEIAVQLSLKTVGDFTRLTPNERQFVRRVFPFYPWMRHITKLALRMPVTAPMRVAWLLHLSAMFGESPEFPFLTPYLPVSGKPGDAQRDYVHVGNVNPFADVTYGSGGPSDISLTDIPAQIMSQSSPAIGAIRALGLGQDNRTGGLIARPTGTGNFDAAGKPAATPLWSSPFEAGSYLANMIPAGRVGRSLWDAFQYGGRIPLRYTNGQVMRSQGNNLYQDRPWYGPSVDLLGVPVAGRETIDLTGLRGRRDERLRRAAAARARYSGGGLNTGQLSSASAWGGKSP